MPGKWNSQKVAARIEELKGLINKAAKTAAALRLAQDRHDLAFGKTTLLHSNLLVQWAEKILRFKPLISRGDYLIITYTPPQNDIMAWRKIVGAELTAEMAEGRKALRGKCLAQIAQRPWLKTFTPLMSDECVAVDRHGVGLFLYASFDLARPSIAVQPLKNLDELAQALARRPRVKRR